MTHIIAGVDHEVGLQRGKRADPGLVAVLSRCHVRIGEVQHADRRRPRRQWRHVHQTNRDRGALDSGGKSADTGGRHKRPAYSHMYSLMCSASPKAQAFCVARCDNTCMPQIKDQLRRELTAAIKSHDTLRSGTIRMALSAI